MNASQLPAATIPNSIDWISSPQTPCASAPEIEDATPSQFDVIEAQIEESIEAAEAATTIADMTDAEFDAWVVETAALEATKARELAAERRTRKAIPAPNWHCIATCVGSYTSRPRLCAAQLRAMKRGTIRRKTVAPSNNVDARTLEH